jgi:hypothetical protein
MSLSVIVNLAVPQMFPGGSIRALDTLRIDRIVERRVVNLRTASAKLNDRITGRSNNSFDPTGNSPAFIENLLLAQVLPGGSIRAFGGCASKHK